MTFRARLFLAIFFFSILPLAYIMGVGDFVNPYFIGTVFALCVFVLLGAMAGAMKVDGLVKTAENRAIRSEVELQVFMERVQDGIFSVDAEGKIREINTAMAQFLRHEPDFLKGKRLWGHLRCERGVPNESFIPRGQVRATYVMTGKLKTGGTLDLLVDLYAQKKGDRFDGFRGCARPVEKALSKEKLRQGVSEELFQILRARLQESLLEVRMAVNPGQDTAAAQASLEGAVNRMLCRLALCFDEGALISWKPKLRLHGVSPRFLLEQLQAKYEPLARRHCQTLSVECLGEPDPFMGDADHLMELLGNLLDNAVKYSPENGEIQLICHESEERRSFAVWDKGIGLSQAELSRLFTPFFRVDNTTNERVPGLGLGLWAAKQIAQAHKGTLLAESELGKGSTFTFSIPKADTDQQIKWID
ncbi:MAG: hypothetical protein HY922_01435 [Elusimicrobia bacterium]|nr:hypothetical protein [Elusimicrobiota bacterium]